MKKRVLIALAILSISAAGFSQTHNSGQSSGQNQEPLVRISTDLVQLDAVVLDKSNRVVRGLHKGDFELLENGKKQQISFFEFVDAGKGLRIADEATASESGKVPPIGNAGPGAADIRRIFAFVVDDLTIRPADLIFVRQMLDHFVDSQMQPTDLVAIVRTIGGEGLFQQFSSDKQLLHKAISHLTPMTSMLNAFNQSEGAPHTTSSAAVTQTGTFAFQSASDLAGNPIDIDDPNDEGNLTLRAYMTLGTASYLIDSMKQLPGRKSMVLVSGGIPILGAGSSGSANANQSGVAIGFDQGSASTIQPLSNATIGPTGAASGNWLNQLADQATRAGVAINTMDIRGLSGQTGVASFEDTPGKSALGISSGRGFGRSVDNTMLGDKNPFDVTGAHMGLRELSNATGGIAVLNRNDFDKGLGEIVDSSDGYYLIAYTPTDSNFKGTFRKVEIKVKGGYKVLSRKGYFATVDTPAAASTDKAMQMLEAIQSPLAKNDLGLDMMVLYQAIPQNRGDLDIELNIDPKQVSFQDVDGKKQASLEVAGFVFNEFGRRLGGFSKTLPLSVTAEEYQKFEKDGVPFPGQHTQLPPGSYEIRMGVRDEKTGSLGTISRYVEIPNLEKGRLSASTLLLGAVKPEETSAASKPIPISANRRMSRTNDLRYAVFIYNPKRKNDKANLTTQLTIMKDGKVLFREPPKPVTDRGKDQPFFQVGQLGLAHVPAGRYVMQLEITDAEADKKDKTIYRTMDFAIVD